MKKQIAINGQVKGLQNITRLGALLLAASFAATSAHAVSASKSVSVGNSIFGASANLSFNDAVSGDMYRGTLAGRVDGKVLTASLSLASGTSNLEVRKPSKCHAFGSLKLIGLTVASWDRSFTNSTSFATAPFFKTQLGGSTRVWLGPVPVTLKASARASISAKGSVTVTTAPLTGLPVVHGTVGPVMDIGATASAGVDVAFAGVEVNGSLTLIGAGVTGNITHAPQFNGSTKVDYSATADIFSTSGAIKVCAWVDPPFLSRSEWCTTVYSFSGNRTSYPLASGSRTINGLILNPIAINPVAITRL